MLDYASRNRENLLFNIYAMGQRSIERGSSDTWTPSPTRHQRGRREDGRRWRRGGGGGRRRREAAVWAALRKPELRDPRGYIIPSDQRDFPTAIEVRQRAARGRTSPCSARRATFTVDGKSYPAGSFVVMTRRRSGRT